MHQSDEAARKARARRLQQEIDEVVGVQEPDVEAIADASEPQGEEVGPVKGQAESPRDFIRRRMRELDRKKE